MNGNDAEKQLPRDEFTAARNRIEDHPEGVKTTRRVDVSDAYGNTRTWNLDIYRSEGRVWVLAQYQDSVSAGRLVMGPAVMEAILEGTRATIKKNRRRIARRVVADKRASGQTLGNVLALQLAREAPRKPRKPRRRKGGAQ